MSTSILVNFSLLKLVLFLFFFSFTNVITGQDYTYTLDEYGFEDGLVYKHIKTVFEDRDGLIWLGTSKGLMRYDGEEFKVWNSDDETGLIYSIRLIAQDDEGVLWLWNSSSNQFVFLNPYSGEIQSTKTKFGDDFPNRLDANTSTPGFSLPSKRLSTSSDGHLYFTTQLLDHFYIYHSSHGFKNIPIEADKAIILGSIEDTLFVGINNTEVIAYSIEGERYGKKELTELEKSHIKLYSAEAKPFENSLDILKGNFNISTYFEAIRNSKTAKIDMVNEHVYSLQSDNWLVQNYSNDTLLNLKASNLQNQDLFRSENLFFDSRNNVWVYGHFGLVRLKLEKNRFNKVLYNSNGSNVACRGIKTDDQNIYINGENLHTTYKVAKSDHRILEQKKYDVYPRALLKLPNDELLIGSAEVYKTNVKLELDLKLDFFPEENYWWGNNYGVWSMHQDEYGTIWAGKGNFLAFKKRNDTQFKSHKPSEKALRKSSNDQCILSIIPEGRDSLWLCSEGGLFLLDLAKDEIVNHYHELESQYLPASKFYHLHKDKAGTYWVGTNKGLIEWGGPRNHEEYKLYTIKENLSNDVIYSVYGDDQNRLWMSSDYGIMSFDKKDKVVQTYLEKDGITHYEFNRTSHYQEPDGRIYFGGLNGVTYFDPKDFNSNTSVGEGLVISELKIFDGVEDKLIDKTGDVLETRTITFKPSDKYFKLKFSLPSFDGKSNKIYAWKIEGIHSDWNIQHSNSIELGMVPYGDYKLLIKGRTRESSWSEEPLEIKLDILKPFYKTLWFLTISALLLFSSIIVFFKLRTRLLERKIKEATTQIISDKRIIEQQTEDLKKLDKLKTQFFTNVSHELRTPLTLMMGPINRMLKTAPENAGDNKQMLDILHRNTVQLRNLVDEILDLSKLENNKMAVDESPVNLHAHLINHLKQYYSFYSSEKLNFETNIEINRDLVLLLDLKKFDKILNNFLANAIKFTSENGDVTLNAIEKEGNIEIVVKDSGMGIHPDDLSKIFNRFYQSKNKTYASEGGTGIGLSLCKELAELMEGRVWAKSELGEGSEFYFTFPIKEIKEECISEVIQGKDPLMKSQNQGSEINLSNNQSGEITILVVEDNKDLREYQKIILGDYNVVVAVNGKDALDYLSLNPSPDLIISDLMMPVMDGMQLIEKVKSSDALRHIPFIMLTAKTNQQVKIKALRFGIDDYLTKPFDEEELRVRIANLLQFQKSRISAIESDPIEPENSKTNSRHLLSEPDMIWLEELEKFIVENLQNDLLSVSLLAKAMSMSESTLLRQLKRLTGLTPGKYIQELRLNQAKEYLLNKTFKSISLVSYNVGFKDSNSFSRTFKKRFGKKPSEIES